MALTDNIVSYYKLDGAAGAVVDSAGSNDGTNNGATRSETGKIGDCFRFDYPNHISVGYSDTLVIDGDITMTAWINMDASSENVALMCWKYGDTGPEYNTMFYWGKMGTGQIRAIHEYGNGTNQESRTVGTNYLTHSGWQFICITRDTTAKNYKFYVDGDYKETISYNTNPEKAASGNQQVLSICHNWPDLVDEVGIWGRALTAEEVTELYNSGDGLTYPFGTPPDPDPIAAPTTSGTVQEGAGGIGTRYIAKRYPATEGLIAGSTKQTGSGILEEE
tara:strand:- start:253 stop:1083 length:831 start_codon:yes stop_codon:yes gene_type:complete